MNFSQKIRSLWYGDTPAGRNARRALKIIIIIGLFIGLFWIVPVEEVIIALVTADLIYLLPGLVLILPSVYLGAVQLKLLIRKHGINLSVFQILVINLIIKFYLLFLPGTLVGSGMRWYKFSRADGKVTESLVAIVFNRLLETFLVVALGLGFWLLSGEVIFQDKGIGLLVLLSGTIILWFILTRASLLMYEWFKSHDFKAQRPFWQNLINKFEKLLSAVSTYADFSALELFLVVTFGVVRILLSIVSFQLLAKSVGIELPFIDMGWIHSVVAMTALLPFSIAGGLGYREVSLIAMLGTFGISADLALAFSFLIFTRNVLLGLMGGVLEAVQTIRVRHTS
jgi:uncharacterized protein (TIRG00374 family)